MTYTLYGCRRSGSLTVELALSEIGLEYELRNVDLESDAQRDPDYAAVNPQRKIPTLQTPAGETLTESVAILLTLDERYPGAGLMPPPGSLERAWALSTLLFVATELYPLIEINDYPGRFSPAGRDNHAVRDIARSMWRDRWLIVEEKVRGDPYFLEQGFCLVDIYIAVVSRWAQQDAWRPKHIPRVERLTEHVASRPRCAEIWARHCPAVTPGRFE